MCALVLSVAVQRLLVMSKASIYQRLLGLTPYDPAAAIWLLRSTCYCHSNAVRAAAGAGNYQDFISREVRQLDVAS